MAQANLLLHPVRMRILQTLLGADELTTAQLRERMPDVPAASMYRHIATLTRAGVIEVVRERPVRGTVERSYRVHQEKALVDEGARQAMTKDDHRQAFTVFTGALMADFERYLSQDDTEPARENVLYRQGTVQLTDEEYAELVEELEAVIARRAGSGSGVGAGAEAGKGRRARHIVSLVIVPDKSADPADEDGDEDA